MSASQPAKTLPASTAVSVSKASKVQVPRQAKKPSAAAPKPLARERIQQFTQMLSAQFLEAVLPQSMQAPSEQSSQQSTQAAWSAHIKLVNPFLPIHPAPLDVAHVDLLLQGIENQRKLKIALRPHLSEASEQATVTMQEVIPLGLVQNATHCMLVFRLKGNKAVHHLPLSRILQVELLGKFIYPKDFSLKDWMNQTFLAKTGQRIRLIFRIERKAGEFLYDTPLSADQHIFIKKKKLEVHATVEDSPILEHWLQSFGRKMSKVRKETIV